MAGSYKRISIRLLVNAYLKHHHEQKHFNWSSVYDDKKSIH